MGSCSKQQSLSLSTDFQWDSSLGHWTTFTFLFWGISRVAFAICLGSLSCWNVNLPTGHSAFWSRVSRICLYLAQFIVPSILTSLLFPAAEKPPHCMILPPPLHGRDGVRWVMSCAWFCTDIVLYMCLSHAFFVNSRGAVMWPLSHKAQIGEVL